MKNQKVLDDIRWILSRKTSKNSDVREILVQLVKENTPFVFNPYAGPSELSDGSIRWLNEEQA